MRLVRGLVQILLVEKEDVLVLGIAMRLVEQAAGLLPRRLGQGPQRREDGVELALLDRLLHGQAVRHRSSYSAARTGFVKAPTPSISIVTSSPGRSQTCGSRNAPTPAGVPVAMRSPGSSVIA